MTEGISEITKRTKPKRPFSRSRRLAATLGRFVPKDFGFTESKTITEYLSTATSEEQIAELLRNGNNQRPSGKTRREWLRIAAKRRTDLGKTELHTKQKEIDK